MLDIIINPFITVLLFLYKLLGGNAILAIVVFTILVRVATYPLTMKQQRSAKAMQAVGPELKKIQEKYKNDREKAAQAQWALYKEYGVNPLAGCLPLLVQLPILMGLYQAIVKSLAATPMELLDMSRRLWVPDLANQVPLANKFLWLNLATPDPLYILPILVVVTTWLQQKLLMPPTSAPRPGEKPDQAAMMSRQMAIIMPLMFGIFALSFASGLSIYFIGSNLIGIGQYALMGKIDFKQMSGRAPEPVALNGDEKPKRGLADVDSEEEKPKRSIPSQPLKPKRAGVSDSRSTRTRAKSSKSR